MQDETPFRTCKKHGSLPIHKWKEKLVEGKYLSYICRLCRNEATVKSRKLHSEGHNKKRRIRDAKWRRKRGKPILVPATKENTKLLRKAAYRRLKVKVLAHYSG